MKKSGKRNGYAAALKEAFPYTIPVLTGYLFIGFAFGVMFQEKGYNFIWAGFMSLLDYAGSGQYLAVNFFVPGISLLHIVFLEFMVNIRHIFYGLSMLERFQKMGSKRWYMIFSLTDETYSLLCLTKVPQGVDETKFLLCLAALDQSYWILGSVLGAAVGSAVPFDATGIDFAMTALFVVIFVEQWLTSGQPYSGIHRAWLHAALPAFVWERQFYPAVDDLHYDAAFGVPEGGEKICPLVCGNRSL